MMMMQYHGGRDYDACHRTLLHRNMANASYYDRPAPYGPPYEPRNELRQEYAGRVQTHTGIQEPDEPLTAGGQARRRIAVAVSVDYLARQSSALLMSSIPSVHDADDVRSSALATPVMGLDARRAGALERDTMIVIFTE